MKKNTEKGFVLAEAIIVAVFVLGMFTYLAMNIFPLITKYDKAINYNDPNETYLVNVLYEDLSSAVNLDDIKGIYEISLDGTNIKCQKKTGEATFGNCNNIIDEVYFKKLLYNHIKAKNIVVYKEPSDIDVTFLSRGIREYFKYSKNKFESSSSYKILVEFENGKYAGAEGN